MSKLFGSLSRHYHSKIGVYGYKPLNKVFGEQVTRENVLNGHLKHASLYDVVKEFREKGHYLAQIDPLCLQSAKDSTNKTYLLNEYLKKFENDESIVSNNNFIYNGKDTSSVKELIEFLKKTYCGTIGVEFMHISDLTEREWFTQKWEQLNTNNVLLSDDQKKELAVILLKCQLFDNFVAAKYPTVKRYACEGAESMIVFFDELFKYSSTQHNITDVIIGMPHRGRLNLLTCLLNFPPRIVFRKMQGLPEFDLNEAKGTIGDVLSHLFTSTDLSVSEDKNIHVSLLPNPSHLEAVNPVVCGKVRGKAMTQRKGPYSQNSEESLPILGVQIHGDAAIAGQGIVTETLAMSGVPHFSTDGSIHCVVNNQIGFTTPGDYCGRTSHYCSDVMKIIDAPCIHVNADFPEEVLKATRLALDYRNAFNKDILIDLVCYRQWGHNELDDPTFTNPLMYKAIHSRSETIAHKYAKQVLTSDEIESVKQQFWQHLNDEFKVSSEFTPLNTNLKGVWSKMVHPSHENVTLWNTGFPVEQLTNIGVKSVEIPSTFKLHPTLNKSLVADRIKRIQETKQIEWSTAECLAFGSLLLEGNNIRISGQDVGRGTFSQRHDMLVDQETGELYIPLNNLSKAQSGHLEIANSILSEEAVLGYEYGMSIDSPKNLIIWEAQFGDFFNGAQIILDTFVSSGELKWLLQSSMVILLPHGYDGAGPEHSSCRIERFLQMCDSSFQSVDSDAVNWCVANPTTPAQYFHLLRRQMVRNYRKPIVIASPKLLLRHPECISHLDDFDNGTHFQAVIDDRTVSNANNVKKVIFCSGKHFYALNSHRKEQNITDVAIVRIEELCPFPVKDISQIFAKYCNCNDFVWSQEEHENMGAWTFVNARFRNIHNCDLKYTGRGPLGTPAVGISSIHKQQQQTLIADAFRKRC